MDDLGTTLLSLARNAIGNTFGTTPPCTITLPALDAPGATFVTLTLDGALRGCIGSLEAWRSLRDDVSDNARNAAFRDPRFPALTADEWPKIRIEVSLLTSPQTISFSNQADALAQLRPDIDGVIFSAGGRRATFLPQVWEQLPDPATFMAHLKRKAGLPPDYWGADVRLERYQVRKWKEAVP